MYLFTTGGWTVTIQALALFDMEFLINPALIFPVLLDLLRPF